MAAKKYKAWAIVDDDHALLDHAIMGSMAIYRSKAAAQRAGWVLGKSAVVRLVPVEIKTQ